MCFIWTAATSILGKHPEVEKLLVVLCGGELFNSPWVPEITVDGELSLKELLSGVIACDDRGSNSTQLNDAIDAAGEILFGSFMS